MTADGDKPDRGLDWVNLLLSAAGAAYGAFIPVYLTGKAWTQTQIGLVLTIGTIVAVVCLLPAGMLIDTAVRRRRRILAIALALGLISPLMLAAWPNLPLVTVAVVLQSAVASLFSPAIAAISLGVAGHDGLSERLGRNARYGSIGAGMGAAVLGLCGILGAERGVFVIATVFTLGALVALRWVGTDREVVTVQSDPRPEDNWKAARHLLRDRRVLVFGLCVALFQIASIAVIQVASVEVTRQLGGRAGLVIAAFVIVPQLVVAWFAPMIARLAERRGRRGVLLAGFATVPARDVLFAVVTHPVGMVPVQIFEGMGGAVFGVMLPLVAADLTRHGGFYTSCLGLFGLASSVGAAISTSVAGWSADRFGRPATYLMLAALGVLATVILAFAMPETGRKRRDRALPAPGSAPG